MSEWQPIDSAPKILNKDGCSDPILLWVPADTLEPHRINIGYWWELFDAWCRINPNEGDTKFWAQPTHWMPLPEPPKT